MGLRRWYSRQTWFLGNALPAVLAPGCRPEDRPQASVDSASAAQPADSLVISNRDGVETWFTLPRVGKSADGKQCLERGLEIRRGRTRVPVPLLYTGEPPVLVNDSTMRAVLWTHCRPVEAYIVDLRSGQPVRERRGSSS
jgi:hypothetical protein